MDFHPDDIVIISAWDELFIKFYICGRLNSFGLLETFNRSLDNDNILVCRICMFYEEEGGGVVFLIAIGSSDEIQLIFELWFYVQ